MKHLLPAAALAALLSAPAATAQTMPGATLPILDGDGDAQVTYEEFSAQMGAIFGAMDSNANRRVEYGEVEGFMARDLFEAADTDGDGALTRQEYDLQIRKDFQAADKDGDGVLD